MGKKGKFIDKANSQKFHLMHRSLTDEAHQNYEVPSNFVLVPASTNMHPSSDTRSGVRSFTSTGRAQLSTTKDHINELGFANDGYDYSQHLREIAGGGTFISKSGKHGTALDLATLSRVEGPTVELPDDCLPSLNKLDRHLEAITINHNLMDKDIKAALFDDEDEEGEFEELQDDFVIEVLNAPAEDDGFDFDAHIAKLIARSEQTLGIVSQETRNRVRFAGDDGEEQLGDSEDEEFPDYLVPEADLERYRQELRQNAQGKGKKKGKRSGGSEDGEDEDEAQGPAEMLSAEAREALELQFERTLAEYDDDELGYLDELQEEDIGGTIDFNEDGNFLDEVLDEFIQAQKDMVFADGTKLQKGLRSSIVDPRRAATGSGAEQDEEEGPVDVQKALREQQARQEETEQELLRMKRAAKDTSIETCQEYLQEVRIDEEWDCETILSTYSTLDNHPTLIKDTNAKFKKYRSPHQRALDAEAAGSSGMSSAGSVLSRSSRSLASRSKAGSTIYGTSSALSKGPVTAPGKIVLSGRLNLPQGFGPTAFEKRKDAPQRSLDSAGPSGESSVCTSHTKGARADKASKLADIAEGDEQSGDSSGSEDSDSDEEHEDGEERKSRSKQSKRRKETPEEKKARKEAVKEERRAKRANKKELKNTFKSEGTRMIRSTGNEQSTDHVSVFKYT